MRAGTYLTRLAAALAATMIFACGGGGGTTDGGDGKDGADGGDGHATFTKPEGYASVTFWVDDTANHTYLSGDMEWKGSFLYDPQTNIVVYDATWAGEQGPYPPLYDDGPIAEGGHEMPGASAGDHIFSVEVYVKAEEAIDREYQYGLINEFDNWIWEGANGEYVLPAGSTDRIDATGYVIPGFGTYDLEVKLDTHQLNDAFLPFDPDTQKVYLKGTMNSWDPRQLLDNGTKGDEVAGDGIYTYHHAENLGPHDGMLFAGQHVQFVFMFDALEYKRLDALSDGVTASTNCTGPAQWEEVAVVLEPESRGRIKNTAVVVCEGGGGVSVTSVVPAVGTPAGGEPVSVYGSGFLDGAQVAFGGEQAAEAAVVGAGQVNCKTPPHAAGTVSVRVTNPGGDYGELQNAFTYQSADQPEILFVEPRRGPTAGGTAVTITGQRFVTGAEVRFGTSAATSVTVTGENKITCQTPAHAAGTVDVSVTNSGGLQAVFPGGFEYVDSTGPLITGVVPASGSTLGGETVTVTGSGFVVGASVTFDGQAAGDILVNPPGAIRCTTPAHQPGPVDVTVTNPDSQSDTLADGFSYRVPLPDWAALQWPMSFVVNAGQASPDIFGRVYEPGLTEPAGCAAAMRAEVGYGPPDSDPAGAGWSWEAAGCNAGCTDCGNNDEFLGTLTIADAGQYWYTLRFSLDEGANWKVAEGFGNATVRGGGDELAVWEVQPAFGSVRGGVAITVLGEQFVDGAVVELDGVPLQTTFVDAGTLRAVTPAHASGGVNVTVRLPDTSEATLLQGFLYVLRGTPDLSPGSGGEIEIETTSGSDWSELFIAGENAAGSNWGDNRADRLYVAYDDQNLYFGIEGWVDLAAGNAIVAYLDIDFGPGTGVANMNLLTDDTGYDGSPGLDAAISSICNVEAAGFGAEFAAGTLGMSAIEPSDDSPQRWNLAGLRSLDEHPDFAWVSYATVRTGPQNQVIEMSLPWQALTGGALPSPGRAAVFVRLVNHHGEYLSNDTLPADDPAQPARVLDVFSFDLR